MIASLHSGEKRLVFVDSRRQAEELGAALREHRHRNLHFALLAVSGRSAAAPKPLSPRPATPSSSQPRRWNSASTSATSTASFRSARLGPWRRSFSASAAPVDALGHHPQLSVPLRRRRKRTAGCRNAQAVVRRLGRAHHAPAPSATYRSATADGTVPARASDQPPPNDRLVGRSSRCSTTHTEVILEYLISAGYFEPDGPFLHIGPEAERRFGRRYFSDLTAVFTAPPEFLVLAGRVEVGTIGTDMLTERRRRPACAAARRPVMEGDPHRLGSPAVLREVRRRRWPGQMVRAGGGLSYDITRGMRDVILGRLPGGVTFTDRATTVLAELRLTYAGNVSADRLVVHLPNDSAGRWWTWAGTAANRSLQASLPKSSTRGNGSTKIAAAAVRSDAARVSGCDCQRRLARSAGGRECCSRAEVLGRVTC